MSNIARLMSREVLLSRNCWDLGKGKFVQAFVFTSLAPAYGIWENNYPGERGPCWIIFGNILDCMVSVPVGSRSLRSAIGRYEGVIS